MPEVVAAIVGGAERGCDVAVVLESEVESRGKVTFEVRSYPEAYVWAKRRRERWFESYIECDHAGYSQALPTTKRQFF